MREYNIRERADIVALAEISTKENYAQGLIDYFESKKAEKKEISFGSKLFNFLFYNWWVIFMTVMFIINLYQEDWFNCATYGFLVILSLGLQILQKLTNNWSE